MSTKPKGTVETGPSGYENWKAALRGESGTSTLEVPFYSDAHVTGHWDELADGSSPYHLLNALPLGSRIEGEVQHAMTVRMRFHSVADRPTSLGTDTSRYHGGWLADELAALVSLLMGARVRSGDVTREFDASAPFGRPRADNKKSPILLVRPMHNGRWRVPQAGGVHNINSSLAGTFSKYPLLLPAEAVSLVRAARLYQDALWIAETEPSMAWLFLVMALEVAAVHQQVETRSAEDVLKAYKPEIHASLANAKDPTLLEVVSKELHKLLGSTARFVDFVLAFLPGPPQRQSDTWKQIDWSPDELRPRLKKIYSHRSDALHNGTPFPAPMSEPTFGFEEVPMVAGMLDATWSESDRPMLLHVFEHITRGALIAWWNKMADATASAA